MITRKIYEKSVSLVNQYCRFDKNFYSIITGSIEIEKKSYQNKKILNSLKDKTNALNQLQKVLDKEKEKYSTIEKINVKNIYEIKLKKGIQIY